MAFFFFLLSAFRQQTSNEKWVLFSKLVHDTNNWIEEISIKFNGKREFESNLNKEMADNVIRAVS